MAKKIAHNLDKQHRYPWAVIETAIELYHEDNNTYRSTSKLLEKHGVEVSHKTVYEWVQKFADHVKLTKKRPKAYNIEESHVKCNGEWKYMYRAHDSRLNTVSVLLRGKRNISVAKNFFKSPSDGNDCSIAQRSHIARNTHHLFEVDDVGFMNLAETLVVQFFRPIM